jgi:hypothetical protein
MAMRNGNSSTTPDNFNFEAFVDVLADRVAAKVVERTESVGATVKPRLLTAAQAGNYIGRTTEAVEHMISSGKLATVRSDRRVFIDIRDLDAWIEENKQRAIV